MHNWKSLRRVGHHLSSRPRPRVLAPGRKAHGLPAVACWRVVCCLVALAVGLALGFAPGQSVRAAPLVVNNCNAGGAGSLAAAVAAANVGTSDTVSITATCTGASAVNPGATLVFSEMARAIAITREATSSGFVVTGGNARTVLQVDANVRVTISGITITGGKGATGAAGTTGTAGTGSTGGTGGGGGAGGDRQLWHPHPR